MHWQNCMRWRNCDRRCLRGPWRLELRGRGGQRLRSQSRRSLVLGFALGFGLRFCLGFGLVAPWWWWWLGHAHHGHVRFLAAADSEAALRVVVPLTIGLVYACVSVVWCDIIVHPTVDIYAKCCHNYVPCRHHDLLRLGRAVLYAQGVPLVLPVCEANRQHSFSWMPVPWPWPKVECDLSNNAVTIVACHAITNSHAVARRAMAHSQLFQVSDTMNKHHNTIVKSTASARAAVAATSRCTVQAQYLGKN